MNRNKLPLRIIIAAAITPFFLFPHAAVAEGPWIFKFHHTPKLMCEPGCSKTQVLPGQYATSINIYNPSDNTVKIYKKVSISYPSNTDDHKKESGWIEHELQPRKSLEICAGDVPGGFFPQAVMKNLPLYVNGVLFIKSTGRVDVARIYQGGSHDTVFIRDTLP